MVGVLLVKLPSDECHWTLLMISQRSGNGLVLSGNKPLPDADLCHHVASLGHNELTTAIRIQCHFQISLTLNIGSGNGLLLSVNKPLLGLILSNPDSKVHRAIMGPTWVLSAPDRPHDGPMNLAIREALWCQMSSPGHKNEANTVSLYPSIHRLSVIICLFQMNHSC